MKFYVKSKSSLRLTEEGAQVHDDIAAKRLISGQQIAACLTAEELTTFLKTLDKIESHTRDLKNGPEKWESEE